MKRFSTILLVLFLLTGCMILTDVTEDSILKDQALAVRYLTEKEAGPETETENAADKSKEVEARAEGQVTGLTSQEKAELLREQQGRYAFSALGVTGQNLYVEILYALNNYVNEMEVSSKDTDEIDRVFQYVMLDHPEIFYADGYSFVKYAMGEEIKKITFTGNYVYTAEERQLKEEQIREAAETILEGIDPELSDYEKVKAVYEIIIRDTEYDRQAVDNQNICSVFLGRESVCQGYAKAAQYLLQKLGIPAAVVLGTVDNGEGHAWNLVQIDHEYYYMDATWGDASYILQDNQGNRKEALPEINYDYLCVTTQDLRRTHSFSDMLPLPECNAMENNYYVREKAYFTDMDSGQLQQLAERYYEEGRETLTIKCANRDVYDRMLARLLEEQEIFNYLRPEGNSIQYTDSPEQLSITFWL